MTTVCSNWADRWPGVSSVQPSSAWSAHVAPVDRNGSMASTRPSHSTVGSELSSMPGTLGCSQRSAVVVIAFPPLFDFA